MLDPGIADEAAKMERRAAKLSEELAAEAEAEKQRLERQVAVGDSIQIMENGESRRKKVAGLTGWWCGSRTRPWRSTGRRRGW